MTIELLAGIPNMVGNAQVFILGSTSQGVDLGIVANGNEASPRIYALGELITIGGDTYKLLELAPISAELPGSAPGTGSGQVVAKIQRVTPTPLTRSDDGPSQM
ncbi:hypothetical protein [Arthrobacter sp. B1I2]|uniref:hypothetical protein n=1 Tax=Arthrobacter sp. B1I2 TaxID=3042263 RepID=UPI002780E31B|nr:hypothetical protein [Arthrobacter sp. B1I2]MDQ0733462.1 hypothetical protein [Arthrobacter sp. B1I2]